MPEAGVSMAEQPLDGVAPAVAGWAERPGPPGIPTEGLLDAFRIGIVLLVIRGDGIPPSTAVHRLMMPTIPRSAGVRVG